MATSKQVLLTEIVSFVHFWVVQVAVAAITMGPHLMEVEAAEAEAVQF